MINNTILKAIDECKTDFELEKIKTKILYHISCTLEEIERKRLTYK